MEGSNYIIITSSQRIAHHLPQEGIDSVCVGFSSKTALKDIEKDPRSKVAIIIGTKQESVKRVGQRLACSGAKTRCYAADVRDCDVLNEPLSSLIGSEDAEKIERITGDFALKSFRL